MSLEPNKDLTLCRTKRFKSMASSSIRRLRHWPHCDTWNLAQWTIQEVPAALAAALTSLTCLDLSNNLMSRIPSSLSQLTSLDTIDLTFSPHLQLRHGDARILCAMSHLKLFRLIDGNGFDSVSIRTLLHMKDQLPNLKIT